MMGEVENRRQNGEFGSWRDRETRWSNLKLKNV